MLSRRDRSRLLHGYLARAPGTQREGSSIGLSNLFVVAQRSLALLLGVGGCLLLALGAVLWIATYLPPGTMTSIALEAMAAIACAVGGVVLVSTAVALRLRS